MKLFFYFFDPIMQIPLFGTICVSIFLALIGVIFFLKKASLLGEALSHGAYPGLILGSLLLGGAHLGIFFGGMLCALFALFSIFYLIQKEKMDPDLSLLFVLSTFFGLGVVLASRVQFVNSPAYQQIHSYLLGQATLISKEAVNIYAIFTLILASFIVLCYRPLHMMLFDPLFAQSKGSFSWINNLLFLFLAIAIVFGIRCVGVVLISGMLVAPAVAARQWTHHLSTIFILAAVFAAFSAYLGGVVSFEVQLARGYLPMGPMIVFIASLLAFFSLLFAPKRGYLSRIIRMIAFRSKCVQENLLKLIWKEKKLDIQQLKQKNRQRPLFLQLILFLMQKKGWIHKERQTYALSLSGKEKAQHIVRLHRLWELYLNSHVGIDKHLVHPSAEEMEHILTKELEEKLDKLLENPKKDPHQQPIPPSNHGY